MRLSYLKCPFQAYFSRYLVEMPSGPLCTLTAVLASPSGRLGPVRGVPVRVPGGRPSGLRGGLRASGVLGGRPDPRQVRGTAAGRPYSSGHLHRRRQEGVRGRGHLHRTGRHRGHEWCLDVAIVAIEQQSEYCGRRIVTKYRRIFYKGQN